MRKWTIEPYRSELIKAVKSSRNYSQALLLLGLNTRNHLMIKKYIREFSIDTKHFNYSRDNINRKASTSLLKNAQVFVKNSKHVRSVARNRIVKNKPR